MNGCFHLRKTKVTKSNMALRVEKEVLREKLKSNEESKHRITRVRLDVPMNETMFMA